MAGYGGQILKIDLDRRRIAVLETDMEMARAYLGGSGFCAALLADQDWDVDPLAPGNRLVFATGPLTGAPTGFCSRYVVAAKSPLTGLYGEAHGSGYWGPELKRAGWDAIVVEGAADRPVHIVIRDRDVQILDAGDLWGMDSFEADSAIRERLGDKNVRVLNIGPGGEKCSALAAVMNDHGRAAARTGLGAVMGAKRLKAISVRGTLGYTPADPERFKALHKQLLEIVKKAPAREALHKFGTNVGMMAFHEMGDMPIKNWTQGAWEDGARKVSGQAISEKILTGTYACRMCPIGCGRVVEVKDGPYAMSGKGPEYETAAGFGPLCLIDDLNAVSKANDLCNRYGIDTISTAAVVALAMECYDKGLISRADTDGLELTWGNAGAMVELVRKIGERDGFGEVLADGSRHAARRIGGEAPNFTLEVKGLELPLHDPRAFSSWAVAYATCPRGGCHIGAPTYWLERGVTFLDLGYDKPMDRFARDGKGRWTQVFQDYCEILECLVMCKFSLYGNLRGPHFVDLVQAATGWEVTFDELMAIGARVFNLKRLILNRMGAARNSDTLPRRILTEKLTDGGTRGHVPDLEPMLDEYYRARGWDLNGVPLPETVARLGIDARRFGL